MKTLKVMGNRPLEPCPTLEPTWSPIPTRSRLDCLEPIGIGTAYIESLTSYIGRLARVHGVLVWILGLNEIIPLFNIQHYEGITKIMFSEASRSLNGTGLWADQTVTALQKLTMRNDLHYLTMLSWRNIFSTRFLLRSTQAWCSTCYEEWRAAEKVLYTPLLWTLQAVVVCPQHCHPLSSRCPNQNCQATIPLISPQGKIGYCPRCGSWLGSCLDEASANTKELDDDIKPYLWQANAVGKLLTVIPYLKSTPSKERLAEYISDYIDTKSAGSVSALNRQFKLPTSTLYSCKNKLQTVQFSLFLEVCYRLEISPLTALVSPNPLESSGIDVEQVVDTPYRSELSFNLSDTDNTIRRSLELVLVSGETPPPCVAEVARRLKQPEKALRKRFPELIHAIVEQLRQYREAEKSKIRQELEVILAGTEEPPPSLNEVARRLKRRSDTLTRNAPDLCQAIIDKRQKYMDAEKLRVQRELETVLASDNVSTLSEVAQQVGKTIAYLQYHFPNFCRAIMDRYTKFQEVKIIIQKELKAILARKDNPVPSLEEVAERFGYSCKVLRCQLPALCYALEERNRLSQAVERNWQDQFKASLAASEEEKLRIRQELEAILTKDDASLPTLKSVVLRFGYDGHTFRNHFPTQCRELVERRKRYREAKMLRIRQELEAILAADETPPPCFQEVARRLKQPHTTLYNRFPDLGRAIIKRYEEWHEAEIRRLHQELEAILANDETPPPSLTEVANRVGEHRNTLLSRFPELCRQIEDRHQKHEEAERIRIRQELEQILQSDEIPPLSIEQVSQRLGYERRYFRRNFPELYQAITERYQEYQIAEKLKIQQALEAVLANDELAPPLAEVARSLGVTSGRISGLFRELAHEISAKYLSRQRERTEEKMKQLCALVKQIVFQIHQEGLFPTYNRVGARLPKPGYMRKPVLKTAWEDALRELGLGG